MILIKKKQQDELPEVYRDWLAENQAEIAGLSADSRPARALWELLGKRLTIESETQIDPSRVRYELQNSLYEEQGGICCYCGDRLHRTWDNYNKIWKFENQSIEHFKGKSKHKELMFNYENLMLSCKDSSGISSLRVGDKIGEIVVEGWEDVARFSGIPIEKIMDYRPNQHLKKKTKLAHGHDVIHIPNPPHCDDEKSKFDSDPNLVIINPTADAHLIEKLVYDADGNIDISNANQQEKAIIKETIKVLALRIDKLMEKRKEVWGKADRAAFEKKYADSLELINNANISNEARKEAMRKLIGAVLEPDGSDGLLALFCFVEYASLKAQFSSIFT